MFEIYLSMNIQNSKFHDLIHALGRELSEGINMKKLLNLYILIHSQFIH